MPTLYLHIGMPKTATTAIQMFCQANREVLQRKGYIYPKSVYRYMKADPRRNGHFIVGKEDEIINVKPDGSMDPWNDSMAMVMSAFEECENVILSDESIWHAIAFGKYDGWKRIKDEADRRGFDIKIIVYLRRQDKFTVSWWNQRLKEGYLNTVSTKKWSEFNPRKYLELDYYKNLEKMSAVYGRENIRVRIFDRGHFKGNQKSIYSDFLDAVGLTLDDEYVISRPEANLALEGNYHEIRRLLNGLPEMDEEAIRFVRQTMEKAVSLTDPDFRYSMFSPEEQRAFIEKYRESNRLVARDYLNKEGDLFGDETDDLPKWTPDNPYMYRDIIQYFGEAVLEQQKTIRSLWEQLSQMDLEMKMLQRQVNSMYKSAVFKSYRKVRKLIKNKE